MVTIQKNKETPKPQNPMYPFSIMKHYYISVKMSKLTYLLAGCVLAQTTDLMRGEYLKFVASHNRSVKSTEELAER